MTSKEYREQLERVKRESGGMRIPSLDQYGTLIELTLRERAPARA